MKSTITFTSALLATLTLVTAAPPPAPGQAPETVSVSYSPKYDVGTSPLTDVACSDGIHGLITQGYTDFASLPGFPNIGGAITIPGWNSPNCGKCYELRYVNGRVNNTINILAVDSATGGFNIGLQAMNTLTNGQAEQLGRINVTFAEVMDSACQPPAAAKTD
ncbi:Cerato-platanin [Penicillium bovifimosum]|uniref:Cerato-platanin n=1 Tax=Penicillium bovifimosum TaxID=126998 RepID=A0A9W9GLX1_9EURO|nr:Cerato-platanin [Penicillium bovifimosum]KAJ5123847.1 Cerato-platanin [Penicillium bovifimosum]